MPEKPNPKTPCKKLPTYEFVLIYSGPHELTDERTNALFEAGCSDARVGIQHGEIFMDFGRKAPSFRIALTSAISDVERSGVDWELVRVDPA